MTRIREVLLMILTAAIIFFGWQNLDSVEVVFLFWRFSLPVALIALVPLLAGLLAGSVLTVLTISRRRRRRQTKAAEEADAELLEAPADAGQEPDDMEAAAVPTEKKERKQR
ncbi:MAG: DUF1049 domain-containing protein [Gemmatimonadota bacterium]|nr:MAG: DUF1049 domain-containing protein [Gemmatimonadota bacterium]